MYIYNHEVLELRKEILVEITNELKNIVNFRIKTNTKAYYELKNKILEWDLKINEITNKLKIGSISELLDTLTINYEDFFVKDSLIEIKPYNLNKKTQMALNNTNIYISEVLDNEYGIKSNEKILYKIDDLIIYGDSEYLDPKNLKKYPIGEDIFWISLNCTLADIEKFNSLYFNISSSK
jgi:hypothetical protein